jgi:hypothetical protein
MVSIEILYGKRRREVDGERQRKLDALTGVSASQMRYKVVGG